MFFSFVFSFNGCIFLVDLAALSISEVQPRWPVGVERVITIMPYVPRRARHAPPWARWPSGGQQTEVGQTVESA